MSGFSGNKIVQSVLSMVERVVDESQASATRIRDVSTRLSDALRGDRIDEMQGLELEHAETKGLDDRWQNVHNRRANIPVVVKQEESIEIRRTGSDEFFRYDVIRDASGRTVQINTDIDCTFSPELTDEVSEFDLLCMLGETDGNTVFNSKIRKSRNVELVRRINDKRTGVDADIYVKGNTVILAINGWHDSPFDVITGAQTFAGNLHHIPITELELAASNLQYKKLNRIYEFLRKKCDEEGKELIVAGYSLGGVLARYIANAHKDDNETRFFSLNAFGSGSRKGREIEAYCIEGDSRSNGDWNNATKSSVILESEFDFKHSLEAYLYTSPDQRDQIAQR